MTGNEKSGIRTNLQAIVTDHAIAISPHQRIIQPNGAQGSWLFDFKNILLQGKSLDLTSQLFWLELKQYGSFQVGGIETAAIGLVAGIIMAAKADKVSLNGFYIRKSRKKDGLQRMVEGGLSDEPIVLVDDVMNTGSSMVRQIELLELLGKKVAAVCTIVRFRDEQYYAYFRERGIKLISLFTLDDFPATGGLAGFAATETANTPPRLEIPFKTEWVFASENPNYHIVIPKSAPVIDEEHVYFGSDNGTFWALRKTDGAIAWKHYVLFGTDNKRIFSSPAVSRGIVYFGAYDGNLYALDAKTGKKRWVYLEADWIGSSPCVAEDLGMVFVGLEFGLWKKQGGIAALDAKTGEKKWWQSIETLVHSSPAYSRKYGVVIVGSSSGTVYGFRAADGHLMWTYESGGAVRASFAIDEKSDIACFGSEDHCVHAIDIRTGMPRWKHETLEQVYANPLIVNGKVYIGCLDKQIRCLALATGELIWRFWTNGRVFASPVLVDGHIFIGSNDGRLYELDPETGREFGFFQSVERIVNKIAYDETTKQFFVPTFANQIYCLTRKPAIQPSASA